MRIMHETPQAVSDIERLYQERLVQPFLCLVVYVYKRCGLASNPENVFVGEFKP